MSATADALVAEWIVWLAEHPDHPDVVTAVERLRATLGRTGYAR